jgi:hypothetical protein
MWKSIILLLMSITVQAQEIVVLCHQTDKKAEFQIWPSIYIGSGGKTLCFNVTGWMDYMGNNCATNAGSMNWSAVVLLMDESGTSMGRDTTFFRAQNIVITDEMLRYNLEWSRDGKWRSRQIIEINRLTGHGVQWFSTEHGGASFTCSGSRKKL